MNAIRSCDTPFLNLIKTSWGANRSMGDFADGSKVPRSVALQDVDSQTVNRQVNIVTSWAIQLDRVCKWLIPVSPYDRV